MEDMRKKHMVTRSYGFLEKFLAKKRADMANTLILPESRQGRILDIGCGTTPYFLAHTKFQEKFGVDPQLGQVGVVGGVDLRRFDVEEGKPLPFVDNFFDVVTMLAVFEHVKEPLLPVIVGEIKRVLKPGGFYVLTTPCPWTNVLLKIMAPLRLVSAEEMAEHEKTYTQKQIRNFLKLGQFEDSNIKTGYFELGMNNWASAKK